jgi:hypothetical protein
MRIFFTDKMQASGNTYTIAVQLDGMEAYTTIVDPAEQRAERTLEQEIEKALRG